MYKIVAENGTIYDSTDKYKTPVTEPVLNLELGQAGNLEFTMLPGHPLHDAIQEMQTFVTAYQDDKILFDGRVLQAEEDIWQQLRVTCEGALTFLLDSEMEPGKYTETISEFFARCVAAHNSQVEAKKHFTVGVVDHDEANAKLEFKLEGYNQTRQVLDNLLISKHGGYLYVRYENGQRYLDYIQHCTKVTNQPIKIGYNVIDKTKHISGENMFTILRPLGKNNVTIEKASSENLMKSPSIVQGKYLVESGGERLIEEEGMVHSSAFIEVTPGKTYCYGPGKVFVSCYDANEMCLTTIEPDESYSVTIPTSVDGFDQPIQYVKLSYHKSYDNKIVFIESKDSVLDGGIKNGYMLEYADPNIEEPEDISDPTEPEENENEFEAFSIDHEKELKTPGWNYGEDFISVSSGEQYISLPGAVNVDFYAKVSGADDDTYVCRGSFIPDDDLGCDIFTIPDHIQAMRVSFQSRFNDSIKVFAYNAGDNLAIRSSGINGKLQFRAGELEVEDNEWCYNSAYIPVEEKTYYTGGPSKIIVSFYDKNKLYLSMSEGNREGLTMHYVKTPAEAAFARVCFLSAYQGEQQFQKGKALILTKLDKGTKTILLPERIAKYGQIIHTETFSEISDAQELYNVAIKWVSLHHSMLPASLDYSIVDFHLLNPAIEWFELGDVYDNIEGFDGEAMTIGSLSKNLENPANDTLTLKNMAELIGPDAGKTSGGLSSKYSGGGGGSGNGSGSSSEEEEEETIPKDLLIKSLEHIGIEAPRIQLLAQETEDLKARIDLIARGKDGNESRITLTDSNVAVNSENIIVMAKNVYNIADNVINIADTVYTHANLIWNEAKDIVSISENLYVVSDNIAVLANNLSVVANNINILADNIDIVSDTMTLTLNELTTTITEWTADIDTLTVDVGIIKGHIDTIGITVGTINANIETLTAKIGKLDTEIGTWTLKVDTLNVDIGTIKGHIGTIDVTVDSINANIGTLTAKIGELNTEIGTWNLKVDALNVDIGAIKGRIGTIDVTVDSINANIGTLTAKIGELNTEIGTWNLKVDTLNVDINTIKGHIGTIDVTVDSINANIGTLTAKIGELNTEIGTWNLKVDTLNTDINTIKGHIGTIDVTVGDVNVQLGSLSATVGTVDTDLQTIKGSALWASRNNITQAVGSMHYTEEYISDMYNGDYVRNTDGTYRLYNKVTDAGRTRYRLDKKLHINDGVGLVMDKTENGSTASFGVYNADTLTAGVLVERITNKTLSGSKTALRLLGEEIDIKGNTVITGLLTAQSIAAGEYVLKDDVKFGTDNVKLSTAITNVEKEDGSDGTVTLTFTRARGAPITINFKKAVTGNLKLVGDGTSGPYFRAQYYTSDTSGDTIVAELNPYAYIQLSNSADYFNKFTRAEVVHSGNIKAAISLSDYWDVAKNAGYEAGWNAAMGKLRVDGNKIYGPSSTIDAEELKYTITAVRTANYTWSNPAQGYARMETYVNARINNNNVHEIYIYDSHKIPAGWM